MTERFPHCDQFVLHAPGSCAACDKHPDLQDARLAGSFNFTGERVGGKWPCPSETLRPQERIERWIGNQSVPQAPPERRIAALEVEVQRLAARVTVLEGVVPAVMDAVQDCDECTAKIVRKIANNRSICVNTVLNDKRFWTAFERVCKDAISRIYWSSTTYRALIDVGEFVITMRYADLREWIEAPSLRDLAIIIDDLGLADIAVHDGFFDMTPHDILRSIVSTVLYRITYEYNKLEDEDGGTAEPDALRSGA